MSIPNLNNGHKTFYENHNVQLEPSEEDQKVSESGQQILVSSSSNDLSASSRNTFKGVVEAAKHNDAHSLLLQMPPEISLQILGKIQSPADIMSVSQSCKQLRNDVVATEAGKQILWMSKMLAAAREWDKQIKFHWDVNACPRNSNDNDEQLDQRRPCPKAMGKPGILHDEAILFAETGYKHFKFAPSAYLNQAKTASRSFSQMAEDMRMDLVEALSEYSAFKKKEMRLLDKLEIPKDSALAEILSEAKRTIKGDVFLFPNDALCEGAGYSYWETYLEPLDRPTSCGPFLECWFTNDANQNWADHGYKPANELGLRSRYAHIDFFMGKREGDRVVIPRTEGRQIMLRLHQKRYRYRGTFDDLLCRAIRRNANGNVPQPWQEAWRAAQDRAKDVYCLDADWPASAQGGCTIA